MTRRKKGIRLARTVRRWRVQSACEVLGRPRLYPQKRDRRHPPLHRGHTRPVASERARTERRCFRAPTSSSTGSTYATSPAAIRPTTRLWTPTSHLTGKIEGFVLPGNPGKARQARESGPAAPSQRPKRRAGSTSPVDPALLGSLGPITKSGFLDSEIVRSFVREGGLEPPRPFEHWHLKPARLPIPPLARTQED